jgi:hypothetical protein
MGQQKHQEDEGCQQQQDSSNSRNAIHNITPTTALYTAWKSATAGRQATAGTSGVVDTDKLTTWVVDTGGKSPRNTAVHLK